MAVDVKGMLAKVGNHQFHSPYYEKLYGAIDSLKCELIKLDNESRHRETDKEVEEDIQEELNSQIAERFLVDLREQLSMLPWTQFAARWKVFQAIRYVEKNKSNAVEIKMCMSMLAQSNTKKVPA